EWVTVFRRRRTDSGQPGNEPESTDSGLGELEPGPDDGGPGEPEPGAGEAGPETAGIAGPWDADGDVPSQERIDFGSLLGPSTAAGVARWSRSASWGWTGPAGSCAASSAARRPLMKTRPGPWSRYSQPSSWSAAITRSRPVTCWRSGFPTRRCKNSARSRRRP